MFGRKAKKIKALEALVDHNEKAYEREKKEMLLRLRRAGMMDYEYVGTDDVKTLEIELDPLAFGNYMVFTDAIDESELEKAKEIITASIVRGLMKNELIQFIRKDGNAFDPLNQSGTFAAKIRIVPWEQMTRSIRIPLV